MAVPADRITVHYRTRCEASLVYVYSAMRPTLSSTTLPSAGGVVLTIYIVNAVAVTVTVAIDDAVVDSFPETITSRSERSIVRRQFVNDTNFFSG